MKGWAWVVAGLYGLSLAALTTPLVRLAFVGETTFKDAAHGYACWPYWLWLLAMVISQGALLSVPVRVASRRPVSRGSLLPMLFAAGLMMGGLAGGALLAGYEFLFRDQGRGNWIWWTAIGAAGLTWCVWTLVFFRFSRNDSPADTISRQCRWLLRGSILELLIAVPTHIVARTRNYCCAGFMTFIGLAMGCAVMLFAYGPAVYFLFVERWRRLHPNLRQSLADEDAKSQQL